MRRWDEHRDRKDNPHYWEIYINGIVEDDYSEESNAELVYTERD